MLQAVGYPKPDLHHMTFQGGGTAPQAPCKWAANCRHHIPLAVAAAAAASAAAAAADAATVNVAVVCLAAVTDSKAKNWPTQGREGSHSNPSLHRVWRKAHHRTKQHQAKERGNKAQNNGGRRATQSSSSFMSSSTSCTGVLTATSIPNTV